MSYFCLHKTCKNSAKTTFFMQPICSVTHVFCFQVQQDSFQSLRIQIDQGQSEPSGFSLGSLSPLGDSLSSLDRDCPIGSGRSFVNRSQSQTSSRSPVSPPAQQTSRYKTEMCRPYQENGTCKYGEKCQFAHGVQEVRGVNRHPKYKTDLCKTYHSVGFCPYGPRCHFVHALDEVRDSPIQTPEKKPNGPVKQLPMFGGSGNDAWNFPSNTNTPYQNENDSKPMMTAAVTQLNKYFNMSGGRAILSTSSNDSSRSGSFCSDLDSNSLPSSSPPPQSYCTSPNDVSRSLRLPIFSRIGNNA